jgi:uncharacterized DUF497 family protein
MNIENVAGFDWDKGNWPKCGKHGVSRIEIEDCFLNKMVIAPDPYPVELEERFNAVGENNEGRKIFLVFMLRHTADGILLRPISARYMHRKEIERYEKRT